MSPRLLKPYPRSKQAARRLYDLKRRTDAAKRFRSSVVWKKARKLKLDDDPLCEHCEREGRLAIPAKQVHHKIRIRLRPDLRLEPSNLESLCDSCHAIYSAKERRE